MNVTSTHAADTFSPARCQENLVKQLKMWPAAAIALTALVFNSAAQADDSFATTSPTTNSSDTKYTVFNPTPEDQLRDMDTDRPDKTNTPHTIDPGHLQIETGIVDYMYDRDQYHGANSRFDLWDLGQFNFRLGVLNNLELNAVINSYDFFRDTDFIANHSTRQNGLGDFILGGKLNLWGEDSGDKLWATALGIQPEFKFPTARQNIGNGHAELDVGTPFLMNLPKGLHLGLETTVSWERNFENSGDVTGWQNSASIDRVFFGNVDFYLEYWAHVSNEHHQGTTQTIDLGTLVQITDNLVLDTGVNFGLNKASPNVEMTSGFSVRF